MAHNLEWQEEFAEVHRQDLHMYNSRNPFVRWIHRLRVKSIMEIVEKLRPERILEVACGDEFMLEEMRKLSFEKKVFGIEISFKRLKRMNKKDGVCAIQADALKLPFKKNSFDLVIASEIMEHLQEYKKAVDEIKNVTRKNGHVIISCPNELNLIMARVLMLKFPAKFPDHVNSFNPNSFDELFGKCIVKKNVPNIPFPLALNFIAGYRNS